MSDNLLNEKTKKASELKELLETKKNELKVIQEEFDTTTSDIIKVLEALEIDSVKMHGFNFYVVEKSSVKTPKDLESKRELFKFLDGKGILEEVVSVNSMTLNSLQKTYAEEAVKEGNLEFVLPGVEEPTYYKQLTLRKI